MYVSRLAFHTLPGQTQQVEDGLKALCTMVARAGGANPRILRGHLASDGGPDVVFEQEAEDLSDLESQIREVTASEEFQRWSEEMSARLLQSPKREIYIEVHNGSR